MKNIIALFFCFVTISCYSQEAITEFDGHKWEAPYELPLPTGWTFERFLVPISFAPQIPYKGVEDIRFAPGWANVKSDEYWTYAFLWYLDARPQTNEKLIAENLKAYYAGLYKVNTDGSKTGNENVIPVKASFKKVKTTTGDLETYSGSIEMMDYMQRKPITLNCIVHVKVCAETNRTMMFHELSPKPFTHANWKALDDLWLNFRCSKS